MRQILLTIMIFITALSYGQNSSIPYANLIKNVKRSVLPIVCIDKTINGLQTSQGTAIQIGHGDFRIFVTCEHVVAIKDSSQKTLGYYKNIFVNQTNKDSTAGLVQLSIDYVDTISDFALLTVYFTPENIALSGKINSQYIQKSIWLNDDSYSEGDNILYIGYPMLKSLTEINYPISRTGIIAQKIDNKDNILIDGFAQHGYSGSPVFLVRVKGFSLPVEWEVKLIGITTSYPNEYADVIEQIGFKQTNKKVVLNPGFTNVTKMSKIISGIEKTYKFKY
jgi:hypothetical protein